MVKKYTTERSSFGTSAIYMKFDTENACEVSRIGVEKRPLYSTEQKACGGDVPG